MAPIPKPKANQATQRKPRNKLKSEILTSTPIKTKLEEAEEKKRQREEAVKTKEKLKDKNSKGVIRKCFNGESSVPSTSKKFKNKQKRPPTPESSDSSEDDVSDICDDDELDDIEDVGLSFIPPPLNRTRLPNEVCGICGEFGKQGELWYRCVLCSTWNHAACTGSDTPKNYKCDLCSN